MPLIAKKYEAQFPHGIMFHHFHDEFHAPGGQGSISGEQFEAILNFVDIPNILNPEEWVYRLLKGKLKNSDVCLTFDDALRCQYDICTPILNQCNKRGFWFVYSSVFEGKCEKFEIYRYFASKYFEEIDDFYALFFQKFEECRLNRINKSDFESFLNRRRIEFPFYTNNDIKYRFIRDELLNKEGYEEILDDIIRERGVNIEDITNKLWLTDRHLKDLSNTGHFIGLHSYSHPKSMSKLSYNKQLEEYNKNYLHIRGVCNGDIVSVSHPSNSYDDNTVRILEDFGILCGFRSNMSTPEGKRINPNVLEIAREDHSNILKKMEECKED